MKTRGALSRGSDSAAALIKTLLLLAVVVAVVGPILWFFPLGGLRSLDVAPVSGRDWLLFGTLLSTLVVAAFLAGVIAPWCDSTLRSIVGGLVVSQTVILPFLEFGPEAWVSEPAGWLMWGLLTTIGTATVVKHIRALILEERTRLI